MGPGSDAQWPELATLLASPAQVDAAHPLAAAAQALAAAGLQCASLADSWEVRTEVAVRLRAKMQPGDEAAQEAQRRAAAAVSPWLLTPDLSGLPAGLPLAASAPLTPDNPGIWEATQAQGDASAGSSGAGSAAGTPKTWRILTPPADLEATAQEAARKQPWHSRLSPAAAAGVAVVVALGGACMLAGAAVLVTRLWQGYSRGRSAGQAARASGQQGPGFAAAAAAQGLEGGTGEHLGGSKEASPLGTFRRVRLMKAKAFGSSSMSSSGALGVSAPSLGGSTTVTDAEEGALLSSGLPSRANSCPSSGHLQHSEIREGSVTGLLHATTRKASVVGLAPVTPDLSSASASTSTSASASTATPTTMTASGEVATAEVAPASDNDDDHEDGDGAAATAASSAASTSFGQLPEDLQQELRTISIQALRTALGRVSVRSPGSHGGVDEVTPLARHSASQRPTSGAMRPYPPRTNSHSAAARRRFGTGSEGGAGAAHGSARELVGAMLRGVRATGSMLLHRPGAAKATLHHGVGGDHGGSGGQQAHASAGAGVAGHRAGSAGGAGGGAGVAQPGAPTLWTSNTVFNVGGSGGPSSQASSSTASEVPTEMPSAASSRPASEVPTEGPSRTNSRAASGLPSRRPSFSGFRSVGRAPPSAAGALAGGSAVPAHSSPFFWDPAGPATAQDGIPQAAAGDALGSAAAMAVLHEGAGGPEVGEAAWKEEVVLAAHEALDMIQEALASRPAVMSLVSEHAGAGAQVRGSMHTRAARKLREAQQAGAVWQGEDAFGGAFRAEQGRDDGVHIPPPPLAARSMEN